MAITKQDVLEYISNLSVLELSELVKEFEEKFGVSAAPALLRVLAVAVLPQQQRKKQNLM